MIIKDVSVSEFDSSPYRTRRERFRRIWSRRCGSRSTPVTTTLIGGPPGRDFFYLTGFDEPDAVALLLPSGGRTLRAVCSAQGSCC